MIQTSPDSQISNQSPKGFHGVDIARSAKLRRFSGWLIVIAILPGLVVLLEQLPVGAQLKYDDYPIYWAAGRLNISGGNPYGLDDLLRLEMEAGRFQNVPMMFWNPPWTLSVIMPLSILPYRISRAVWYLMQLLVIIAACHWTWRQYKGASHLYWVAWCAGLGFMPALQVLKNGQISALPLIGVVGFMSLQNRRRYFGAGMLLAFIAIKPHMYYLLAWAIILWSFSFKKWRILLGSAFSLGAALFIAFLFNPRVIQQYAFALANYPPRQWASATIGGALRFLFAIDHFWLQFVPSLLGFLVFSIYWWKKRIKWDWKSKLPLILVFSAATAPYGWTFDNIAAVIAVVQILALLFIRGSWRLKVLISCSYIALDVILFSVKATQLWFWWAPFMLAIWYLFSSRALLKAKTNILLLKPR
jgi:hypothetical protein